MYAHNFCGLGYHGAETFEGALGLIFEVVWVEGEADHAVAFCECFEDGIGFVASSLVPLSGICVADDDGS